MRVLRSRADDFSFSRTDDQPTSRPDAQFADILREGPALGVHTLLWCDTLTAFQRMLDRQGLREFNLRVLLQMSATDSSLLIDSPTAEIPKQIGLYGWRIAGRPLMRAQEMLEALPGVDLVARFGAEIHVCGKDSVALERAVRAVKGAEPHVEIAPIEPGFEEIFIYLMSGAMDNFQ